MRTYLALFAVSAGLAALLAPRVAAVARRLRAYGHAHDGRCGSSVPRLGGLAVVLAAAGACALLTTIHNNVSQVFLQGVPALAALLLPGALILALGIYDDLRGTNAWQKFSVQVMAATLVWAGGCRITQVPVLGLPFDSDGLSLALTVLWVVAVTNSFNLIDGVDGLAAGVAFFVTLSVFAVSVVNGQPLACILSIALAGALLGFLRYNFHPARVYLGDTGSLFLGFFLSVLAMETAQKSSILLAVVVPFVAFGLPLFDTALTLARRLLSGAPLFRADCNHTHHRLQQAGLTPVRVTLMLYAVAAVFSLGSLLIVHSTGSRTVLALVLIGTCAWLAGRHLRYEEFQELNRLVVHDVHTRHRVLANHILLRKAAAEIRDADDADRAWTKLREVAESMGFVGMRCMLYRTGRDDVPEFPAWSNRGSVLSSCMAFCVPLFRGGLQCGELWMWREPDCDMLFEYESFCRTAIGSFSAAMHRRHRPHATAPASMEQPAATLAEADAIPLSLVRARLEAVRE